MYKTRIAIRIVPMLVMLQPAMATSAQTGGLEAKVPLNGLASVVAMKAVFKGKGALRLTDSARDGATTLIPLQAGTFKNGTITADIAGQPRNGAPESARGFVGIAFRVGGEQRYESIYLRPTNGRSSDQFRRNHTVQYISMPDFDWPRLRTEHPGKYESYANVAPNAWSKLRIVVAGQTARLYVNGEEQPALIVNDLKLGDGAAGGVALWIGPHTDAYFANVAVTHDP